MLSARGRSLLCQTLARGLARTGTDLCVHTPPKKLQGAFAISSCTLHLLFRTEMYYLRCFNLLLRKLRL